MKRIVKAMFCIALAAWGGAHAASCPLPTFQRGADVVVPSSGAETLFAGDVNNDGKADLVSRTNGNAIQVMLGDGAGHFTLLAPLSLSEFSAFGLGDLNRDGKLDLVVATVGGLHTYLGRGDGTFSLYVMQAAGGVIGGVPGSPNPNQRFLWGDMQLFDLDGDGHLDVIGADYIGNRILVLFGAADGIPRNRPASIAMGGIVPGFAAFYPPSTSFGPRRGAIGFAAMNGNRLGVREYTPALSSFFFSTVTQALPETPFRVAAADLDNDGKPELVASDFQFTGVTVLDAQSQFGQPVSKLLTLSHRVENLALADFNGDGLPDLVGANRAGELIVFPALAGKAFGPGQVVASGSWLTGIAIADFDRDGALDIAAVDKAGGKIVWVHNNCVAAPADLAIASVEVVQNLQDSANSVPLVAGRRSFVRVLTSGNAVVPGMDGLLTRLDLQGQAQGAPLRPVNQGAAILQPLAPSRQRFDDTLVFELPADWLTAGTLRLQAEVNTAQRLPEDDMANNRRSVDVTFTASQPLPVTLVRLKWRSNGVAVTARESELELSRAELLRRMPVPTLDVIDRELDYDFDDMGFTSGPLNYNWIPDAENWNATFEPAEKRLYYFLAAGPNSGIAGGAAADIGARVAVGSADVIAHEFGHLLGLRHVNPATELDGTACEMATGPGLYPYPGGMIGGPAGDTERFVGLDAGAYVDGVAVWSGTRVVGSRAGDEMSYCKERWFSDFSIRKLIGEIDLRFAAAPPTLWLADVGSDTPLPAPPTLDLPEPGDWLSVFGTVGALGKGKGPALRWRALRTDTLGQRPGPTDRRLRVRVLAANGSVLAEADSALSTAGDRGGGVAFRAVMPFPPTAARIELVDTTRDLQMGVLKVSRNAPTVKRLDVVAKTDTAGRQRFELRWLSADRDGDALRHVILASGDEGQRWSVVAVNVAATSYSVSSRALPWPAGGAPVRFRVLASDGVLTATADSPDLRVASLPPTLSVTSPAPGLQIAPGQAIALQAIARERDNVAQALPQISWHSDRDGAIATGVLAHFTPRTAGIHVVTGTARSAAGLEVRIQRSIVVDSQGDRSMIRCTVRKGRLLAVGGVDSAGQRWQREVGAVVADMGAGLRYRVIGAAAKLVEVAVVRPAGRRAYLRAPRDAQAANNLSALPACGG